MPWDKEGCSFWTSKSFRVSTVQLYHLSLYCRHRNQLHSEKLLSRVNVHSLPASWVQQDCRLHRVNSSSLAAGLLSSWSCSSVFSSSSSLSKLHPMAFTMALLKTYMISLFINGKMIGITQHHLPLTFTNSAKNKATFLIPTSFKPNLAIPSTIRFLHLSRKLGYQSHNIIVDQHQIGQGRHNCIQL